MLSWFTNTKLTQSLWVHKPNAHSLCGFTNTKLTQSLWVYKHKAHTVSVGLQTQSSQSLWVYKHKAHSLCGFTNTKLTQSVGSQTQSSHSLCGFTNTKLTQSLWVHKPNAHTVSVGLQTQSSHSLCGFTNTKLTQSLWVYKHKAHTVSVGLQTQSSHSLCGFTNTKLTQSLGASPTWSLSFSYLKAHMDDDKTEHISCPWYNFRITYTYPDSILHVTNQQQNEIYMHWSKREQKPPTKTKKENKASKCSNHPYSYRTSLCHLPDIVNHQQHQSCFMQLFNSMTVDCTVMFQLSHAPLTLSKH